MKITTAILKHLSHQISHGNPWWGLVVANEYVRANSPLHHALAVQFLRRVGAPSGDLKRLADKLSAGARYNELSPALQIQVGRRESGMQHRTIPLPMTSRRSRLRMTQRVSPRRQSYKTTQRLVADPRDGQGIGRPVLKNQTTSSLAPHATLRGVRMS